ncbi:MAG: hypothetical protein M3Q05_07285 [Bacteroidota bacterium]|nr:hypothetical protein [Bacteroidota bacterium]
MATFKYTQASLKFSIFTLGITLLTYKALENYLGFGMVMFLSLAVEVIFLTFLSRYFNTVVEFRDSYLLLKKGFFSKEEKIKYSDFRKIAYSNATRFLKLSLYTNENKIELPPPTRLAQAEELFTWLRTKNPAIEFEIERPQPALELN